MNDNQIIEIGIVNDPLGSFGYPPEKEAEDIIDTFRMLGLDCKLAFHTTTMAEAKDKSPDMLVIDYGGMGDSGAWDAAQYQVRYACRWAEEHPGKPMVIWTVYTKDLYEGELEKQFGHLGNVFARYTNEHYNDLPFIERIAIWLGIKLDRRKTKKYLNVTTLKTPERKKRNNAASE